MTANGRQAHVLAIDDSKEILELLPGLLEAEGYRVTTSRLGIRVVLKPFAIAQLPGVLDEALASRAVPGAA